MKMTKSEAMTVAMNLIDDYKAIAEVTEEQLAKLDEARGVYERMKAILDKPRTVSPASQEKIDAKKEATKAATAKARAELIKRVAPILRKYLITDITVKELAAAVQGEAPDMTEKKVQNILIRELKPELVRTERKHGGDLYRLA